MMRMALPKSPKNALVPSIISFGISAEINLMSRLNVAMSAKSAMSPPKSCTTRLRNMSVVITCWFSRTDTTGVPLES